MDTPIAGFGRRKVVAIAVALVVCAVLGFGIYLMTRDDLVIDQYRGVPPGARGGDEATAVVMMDAGTIHVTTMGSSSCPAVPIDVTIIDGVVVTVDVESDGPCTADYGPTTSVIAIPDGLRETDVDPTVRIDEA